MVFFLLSHPVSRFGLRRHGTRICPAEPPLSFFDSLQVFRKRRIKDWVTPSSIDAASVLCRTRHGALDWFHILAQARQLNVFVSPVACGAPVEMGETATSVFRNQSRFLNSATRRRSTCRGGCYFFPTAFPPPAGQSRLFVDENTLVLSDGSVRPPRGEARVYAVRHLCFLVPDTSPDPFFHLLISPRRTQATKSNNEVLGVGPRIGAPFPNKRLFPFTT